MLFLIVGNLETYLCSTTEQVVTSSNSTTLTNKIITSPVINCGTLNCVTLCNPTLNCATVTITCLCTDDDELTLRNASDITATTQFRINPCQTTCTQTLQTFPVGSGTLVSKDSTDTLTNKTLDSELNTIHACGTHTYVRNAYCGPIPAGKAVYAQGYHCCSCTLNVDRAENC